MAMEMGAIPEKVELTPANSLSQSDLVALSSLVNSPNFREKALKENAAKMATLIPSIKQTLQANGFDTSTGAFNGQIPEGTKKGTLTLLAKVLKAVEGASPAPAAVPQVASAPAAAPQVAATPAPAPAALSGDPTAQSGFDPGRKPGSAPQVAATLAPAPIETKGPIDKIPATLAAPVDGKLAGPDRGQLQVLMSMPADKRTEAIKGNPDKFVALNKSIEATKGNVKLPADSDLLTKVAAEIRSTLPLTVLAGNPGLAAPDAKPATEYPSAPPGTPIPGVKPPVPGAAPEVASAGAPKLDIAPVTAHRDAIAHLPAFSQAETGKACTAESCPKGTPLVVVGENLIVRDKDFGKTDGRLRAGTKVESTGEFVMRDTSSGPQLFAEVTLPDGKQVMLSAAYLKLDTPTSSTVIADAAPGTARSGVREYQLGGQAAYQPVETRLGTGYAPKIEDKA